MPSRRRFLATVAAAAGTVGTAGCLDTLLGGETPSFSASPATVAEATLERTGYEHRGTTVDERRKEFGAGPASQTVRVRNYRSQYVRSVEIPGVVSAPAALFVAFTSPKVRVLGGTFNPLDDLSTLEILERAIAGSPAYSFVSLDGAQATFTVDVLGKPREFTSYEGRAELLGVGLDITIRIGKLRHDGDFVVLVGVYPERLFWEGSRVRRLARGVQH